MAWGIVILCLILGGFLTLRPSSRQKDFKRQKDNG